MNNIRIIIIYKLNLILFNISPLNTAKKQKIILRVQIRKCVTEKQPILRNGKFGKICYLCLPGLTMVLSLRPAQHVLSSDISTMGFIDLSTKGFKFQTATVYIIYCLRSLDPFSIVSYYINWLKTSLAYTIHAYVFLCI